ncbi:MAG: hypothetical protein IJC06_02225 [Clostridia bacterium]|nr:hypothetical protein [Clostridia bacterium]
MKPTLRCESAVGSVACREWRRVDNRTDHLAVGQLLFGYSCLKPYLQKRLRIIWNVEENS